LPLLTHYYKEENTVFETSQTKPHQFILIQTRSHKAEQTIVLKQRKVSEIICQNEVSEDSLLDRPTGIQGACSSQAAMQLSKRVP